MSMETLQHLPEILVVEDDPRNIQILSSLLGREGYHTYVATDGELALDYLDTILPDLILLDLGLPKMDGFEICERLKSNPATRLIPVVVLTGQSDFVSKLRCIELGADDFISKPFNSTEVLARCKSLLRLKNALDALDDAERVIYAFARAVEAKDPYTEGHTERVTAYALSLAERIGLNDLERAALKRGAILHDVGKIGVPDDILRKPGPLTPEEFDRIRQHPIQGVTILEPLQSVRDALPVIRWHHERMDGSGYPDGLTGDQIPVMVRIMTIADVYDALTTRRPYHEALSPEEGMRILREGAGRGWWDRELVSTFVSIVVGKYLLTP
jgi:putative two-component system response regulator